jgi:hypothetical protein
MNAQKAIKQVKDRFNALKINPNKAKPGSTRNTIICNKENKDKLIGK